MIDLAQTENYILDEIEGIEYPWNAQDDGCEGKTTVRGRHKQAVAQKNGRA
jgi:hypothetical protein